MTDIAPQFNNDDQVADWLLAHGSLNRSPELWETKSVDRVISRLTHMANEISFAIMSPTAREASVARSLTVQSALHKKIAALRAVA